MKLVQVKSAPPATDSSRTHTPVDDFTKKVNGIYFRVLEDDDDDGVKKIFVKGGITYIIMDLCIEDAVFVYDPIQWFHLGKDGNALPAPAPPFVRFQRITDRRIVLFSENFSPDIEKLQFWIVVYDRKQDRIREADPGVIFEPFEPPGLIIANHEAERT